MKKLIVLSLIFFTAISCSKNIEPINYGEDMCDFCSMTIVERGHASQVVTNKGKNFKFDAAECLIHYLEKEENEGDMLHLLVANYLNPGELLDAKEATFIISENIPSPMGANLSAVKTKADGEGLQKENGGNLLSWSEIKGEISMANVGGHGSMRHDDHDHDHGDDHDAHEHAEEEVMHSEH